MTPSLRLAWRSCTLSLAIAVLALDLLSPAKAAGIVLKETGSTLLYPLFQMWIRDYPAVAPGVTLTAAATGSGTGEKEAMAGQAQIGASDAYLSEEDAEQNPEIKNIPVAISAQTVNFNIPALKGTGLNLDGPTLAAIYTGRITEWDAAPIKAMNPGLDLPHQTIVPIRREDASGDTFIFTYIGISFRDAVAKAGLGTALLKSQNGKFLPPTVETITAGASALDPRTPPDERLTPVFAPGDDSYPLVNYEYVVVSIRQPDPETAAALRKFLLWTISLVGGNAPKYLDAVGFIPLPDFIRGLSEHQINLIK
jgi:phosphate transport system substrate-binding protein